MNSVISWIAAEAQGPKLPGSVRPPPIVPERASSVVIGKFKAEGLPVHQFPGSVAPDKDSPDESGARSIEAEAGSTTSQSLPGANHFPQAEDDPLDRRPELRAYRGRTIGMLRRYLRYSLETGRLPSLLGREFFRTRVTSYSMGTFEDRVILVHDMESCLQRLTEFSRQLIARSILQEHDLPATARLFHCNEKTIRRTIPMALDELSEILLEVGLLEHQDSAPEKSCQGGKTDQFPASDSKQGKNKL